jgi:Cu/Ag efflux protein CusF
MRGYLSRGIVALFIVVSLFGCSEKQPDKPDAKVYDIQGKITGIREDKTGVTLDHEDIPGLMKGMKMEFSVKDAKLLEGLQVGDPVRGKLQVESGKYLITELKKR